MHETRDISAEMLQIRFKDATPFVWLNTFGIQIGIILNVEEVDSFSGQPLRRTVIGSDLEDDIQPPGTPV